MKKLAIIFSLIFLVMACGGNDQVSKKEYQDKTEQNDKRIDRKMNNLDKMTDKMDGEEVSDTKSEGTGDEETDKRDDRIESKNSAMDKAMDELDNE
ncbi:hypothetical protein JXR93_14045 [bacterium]|nr:hypothetical protein [bacterium]